MKKSPLILLPLILIGLGGVYALMQPLLPDTSEFPRVPTADGTIGGYIARILGVTDLANYVGDGTVENTESLSGLTALDILRARTNCNGSTVFHGIDGSGTPTCSTDSPVLAYLGTGTILTGGVTAYRADGTIKVLALNDPILEGDIIKTNVGAGITITFLDGSLLRIDGDSTVSLDIGTTYDGRSIAYAILENGGLWGRVLTETGGYYIGNDDLIAGVRGTSVAFTQSNPGGTIVWNGGIGAWEMRYTSGPSYPSGQLSVIHSRTPDGAAAADVECTSASGVVLFSMVKGQNITTSHSITCDDLKRNAQGSPIVLTSTGYYMNNPQFAANTLADLAYMSGRLAAGGLSTTQAQIFSEEYAATRPTTSEEKSAICSSTVSTSSTKTYWESLLGTHFMSPCIDERVIAVADYTNIVTSTANLLTSLGLYKKEGGLISASPSGLYAQRTSDGILIDTTGEYISYNDSSFFSSLGGKTVTIELGTPIGQGIATAAKMYVANFGNEMYFIQKDSADCIITTPGSGIYTLCKKVLSPASTTPKSPSVTNSTAVSFQISLSPSQFLLGNNTISNGTIPLMNTIKKVSIQ